MAKKSYVVTLAVKAESDPSGWDWLTLLDEVPGNVKLLAVEAKGAHKKPEKNRTATVLFDAGERVLTALQDDHESCGLCGAEENRRHEGDAPCGALQDAVELAREDGYR